MSPGILIIGTGMAGYAAARALRAHDADTPLTLISRDSGESYNKPKLSTGYRQQQAPGDLIDHSPAAMAEELDARLLSEAEVTAIDPNGHAVELADGSRLPYQKLVLATGAASILPPISGLDGAAADRCYLVNDLGQYGAFRAAADRARRVLIIGGGLIGCEFANDLAESGREVVLVHAEPHLLDRLLPAPAAAAVQSALTGLSVDIHTGALVTAVEPHGEGILARLADGVTLEADVGLVCVGLAPQTGLARAAGLAVNRGIVVDRYLRTSAPDVYALGDCAEVEGHLLQYVAPLNAAAKALGKTLAGEPTAAAYPAMPVAVKTSCCRIVALPPALGAAGAWSIDGAAPDLQCEYRSADGQLLGFALTGKRIVARMGLCKELPALF